MTRQRFCAQSPGVPAAPMNKLLPSGPLAATRTAYNILWVIGHVPLLDLLLEVDKRAVHPSYLADSVLGGHTA